MDLKQLTYFLAVVEHASFSQAARALTVTQPALSRQVRLLEVELRQNLLLRNGRGVRCTEAGEMMAKHARLILQDAAVAQSEMDNLRGVLSGHVTITIPTSLSNLLTVPLIDRLMAELPSATFSLSDGLSSTTQELLVDKRLDIALLYEPECSSHLDVTPIMEQELFLIRGAASEWDRTQPISLSDAADLPLVIPRRPHGIRILVESAMRDVHRKPRICMEADSIHMILDFLAAMPGYAILPLHSIASYSSLGRFHYRRIVDPDLHSRLFLATAAHSPSSPTKRAALKVVHDVCRVSLFPAIQQLLRQASAKLEPVEQLRLNPCETVRLVDLERRD